MPASTVFGGGALDSITFTTRKGRVYTVRQVRPVVMAMIRKRWGDCAKPGWQDRVAAKFTDDAWLRWHNGCVPAALVRDLDGVVLGYE